jgi:hypothetical protein
LPLSITVYAKWKSKGGISNLKEIKFQSKQVTVVTVYYDIVFYINAKIFFLITKQHESIFGQKSVTISKRTFFNYNDSWMKIMPWTHGL